MKRQINALIPVKVKWLALLFMTILLPAISQAQKQDWKSFFALFDGTAGRIDVDLKLKQNSISGTQPFLVMTAIKLHNPTENGLLSETEGPTVKAFINAVKTLLSAKVKYSYAGNFIHNSVEINYFYVTDTLDLRQRFLTMYAKEYPNYSLGLTIKHEPQWNTYLKFLVPVKENYKAIKDK